MSDDSGGGTGDGGSAIERLIELLPPELIERILRRIGERRGIGLSTLVPLGFFGDEDPDDAIDAGDEGPGARAAPVRLTDMAAVLLRGGLQVVEVDGWEERGRAGDGGFYTNGRPDHIMIHHTASQVSAINDVAYMTFNSPIAPIANLYVARDGLVWVMAGGPTNTNGRGVDTWGGGVADNNMNRHAIGIEIGNNGVGERYPRDQELAVLRTTAVLAAHYDISAARVRGHFEYSPTRKIDPFGPSWWTDYLAVKWFMDRFRADVQTQIDTPPPSTGDEMPIAVQNVRIDSRGDPVYNALQPNTDQLVYLVGGEVPQNATWVIVDLTAVPVDQGGWIAVFDEPNYPGNATINFTDHPVSNQITVPLVGGSIKMRSNVTVNWVLDIVGYYL